MKKDNFNHSFSKSQALAYSLPCIVSVWLFAPMSIVQGVFAKHYHIELTQIAGVILIARLFDAVSDPMVGVLSDRYYIWRGTRKPFVITGSVLMVISGLFLYIPPETIDASYILVWFIVFYAAWTLFEIPHVTWGGDLVFSAEDKTKIYSYRAFMAYIGLIVFYTIPLLPFFSTTEITPQTLKWSAISAAIVMFPLISGCILYVGNGLNRELQKRLEKNNKSIFKIIFSTKPLAIFLSAYFFLGVGSGMWYGLIFIYVDSYLGFGLKFSQIFLIAFFVGAAASTVWYQIAEAIGKKNTLLLTSVFLMISYFFSGYLDESNVTFTLLLAIKIMNTIGFSGLNILPQSILSDISDYAFWKHGKDTAGTCFSLYILLTKFNTAIGGAFGLALAGWYGFDPSAVSNTAHSIFGLKLGVAVLPLLMTFIAVVIIMQIPINERRHSIVSRRLSLKQK